MGSSARKKAEKKKDFKVSLSFAAMICIVAIGALYLTKFCRNRS
jgi:hypothetical protein